MPLWELMHLRSSGQAGDAGKSGFCNLSLKAEFFFPWGTALVFSLGLQLIGGSLLTQWRVIDLTQNY